MTSTRSPSRSPDRTSTTWTSVWTGRGGQRHCRTRAGSTAYRSSLEDVDVTKGNLSSHVQKLEDAGCVEVEKEIVDGQPRTSYRLTDLGRSKFEGHVDTLETVIGQVEE